MLPKAEEGVTASYEGRLENLGKYWFLIDIPLFIDTDSIGQLYDAMVRPEWRSVSRVRTEGNVGTVSLTGKGEASGKASIPIFLQGDIKVGLDAGLQSQRSNTIGLSEELNRSPEMTLEKIVNRYASEFPGRLLYVDSTLDNLVDLDGNSYSWELAEKKLLTDEPGIRPLVVVDMAPGVKIMPMFAETVAGEGLELHKALAKALQIDNVLKPYPPRKSQTFPQEAVEHWDAYASAFKSGAALPVVEGVKARLQWINFRVCAEGQFGLIPLHLNIVPRGAYSNGTFAYQFIRRADNYGARIIGTLKRGKDINVLGIYER
jgi:hypothetical protein